MPVYLKEITAENWYACTQLSVREEQKALFPVPVVYWMASSKYEYNNELELLAVYCGACPVGIVAYGIDPDIDTPWITTVMIDQKYQGKGYGKKAVKQLIKYICQKHPCKKIIIAHRPDNLIAANLYASLGFKEVDRTETEIIRCLDV